MSCLWNVIANVMFALPLCVVFVASVWCHTFRIPISTSTEHGSPPPRTNEELKPKAFQTLLTHTFILGESPIWLQSLFPVLYCLRLQSSRIMALGASRELLSGRVMQDSLCILLPMHSGTWIAHQSLLWLTLNALRLTVQAIWKRVKLACW